MIISLLSIQCWQNEHLLSILLYSCYMNIKEILYSYARYILASSEKEFYFLRTKCTLMIQNMIHSKYSNISFLRQYTISWYPANLNLYKFLKLNLYFKLMNKNLINLYPHHDIKNKFGISIGFYILPVSFATLNIYLKKKNTLKILLNSSTIPVIVYTVSKEKHTKSTKTKKKNIV